jgi:hypothetical protein
MFRCLREITLFPDFYNSQQEKCRTYTIKIDKKRGEQTSTRQSSQDVARSNRRAPRRQRTKTWVGHKGGKGHVINEMNLQFSQNIVVFIAF